MFYEENQIRSILDCDQCNSEYDKALILPCGFTICTQCLVKGLLKGTNQFECSLCMQIHMQPEFGFPENQAILTLMAEQPKTLCKSSEIEVVRALMEETRFELNKLEFEIDHAEEKIKDHFNEQKRIIQLKTEETMEEVSRIADKLINEMNAYEKYCLNEMEAKKDENRSYLEKVIKPELNEYRETVNSYLKLTQLDIEQVKKANEIVLKMKMNIQDEISNSFSSLMTFNKKLIVFNPNKNSVNEILLGSIDYQQSQSNKIISGSWNGVIKIWDLVSNKCVKTLQGHSDVICCLKRLGNTLISGSCDGILKQWDLKNSKCLKTIKVHSDRIRCIQIMSFERVVTCDDKTIKLWNLNNDECLLQLKKSFNEILSIEKVSSDKLVICSADETIKVWNMNTGECLKVLDDDLRGIRCMNVISSEKILLGSWDNSINLWNLKTGNLERKFEGHTDLVRCVLKISNEKIVSCSRDKTIKVWQMNTAECLKTIDTKSESIWNIDSLACNKIISSDYKDSLIRIWDLNEGVCIKSLDVAVPSGWCLI